MKVIRVTFHMVRVYDLTGLFNNVQYFYDVDCVHVFITILSMQRMREMGEIHNTNNTMVVFMHMSNIQPRLPKVAMEKCESRNCPLKLV